jgi:hypothetical protein
MRQRPSARLPIASIAIAISLFAAGPVRAGDGGEDAGSAQVILNDFCAFLGMSSCPQLPTVTQAVLEIAGLQNSSPDYARGPTVLAACSVAGNALRDFPPTTTPCGTIALNAVNRSVAASLSVSDLSNLTPLAFTINKQGQAVPTQLGSASAVSFLYAVATGMTGQPDALQLFYDYPGLTSSFTAGKTVANISLPLQVLQADGSERLVCGTGGCPNSIATLQVVATCNGTCVTVNVIGDFSTAGVLETHNAAELGIEAKVTFQPSPNSKQTHAIFQVAAPLLVIGPSSPAKCGKAIVAGTADAGDCGNDPAYFGVTPAGATNGSAAGSITGVNQITGLPTAFSTNALGFTPPFLGKPVGIAPSATPSAVPNTTTSTYPFCASFLVKGAPSPAAAAFYSIATDGTANLSAPLNPAAGISCPF